jgi:hypothetical protein
MTRIVAITFISSPKALQPLLGQGLLIIESSRSHSDTPLLVGLPWRVISPMQRPLLDKTQHSQETDIHAPGGIRSRNLSKREAADQRLRPRGHWNRLSHLLINVNNTLHLAFLVNVPKLWQILFWLYHTHSMYQK